jgi:uncharacterized membrane protein
MSGMLEIVRLEGWISNHVHKAAVETPPTLGAEYLRVLAGALLCFGIAAELVLHLTDIPPVYVLVGLGLVYSVQITHHRYRLAVDPGHEIRGCACFDTATGDTAAVLRSRESALLGVPNSVVGAVLYAALALAVYLDQSGVAIGLAAVAILGSAYLSYVMIVRLASLCPLCINVAALNVLLVVYLVR